MGVLLFTELQTKAKLPYTILPKWKKHLDEAFVKSLLATKDEDLSQEQIDAFKDHFEELLSVPGDKQKQFEKEWGRIEKAFLNDLNHLIPNLPFDEIKITLSQYGLRGWQYVENRTLHVAHRADFSINYIVNAVIRSIIVKVFSEPRTAEGEDYYRGTLWIEQQSIMTFLLLETRFAKYLTADYISVKKQVEEPQINVDLKKLSDENYRTLGFPTTKALRLNGLITKLNDEKLTNLTETQDRLLVNFLKHEEEVVSNDDIAKIMWGEDHLEKFSLAAMIKMIHQLRQKLKVAGLQKEVIFTKRGEGYVLIQ